MLKLRRKIDNGRCIIRALIFWAAQYQSVVCCHAAVCPVIVSTFSSCLHVASWRVLKNILENSTGEVVLCPFHVKKDMASSPAVVTNSIIVICDKRGPASGKCTVDGPGSHIQIIGGRASATFQRLNFQGATEGSVRVFSSATSAQSFCYCNFIK